MGGSAAPSIPPPQPPAKPLTLALNQKIREFLAEQRWSQREFARQLGRSQSSVSYWLNAKRRMTALEFYQELAAVMGIALSELIADLEHRVAETTHATPEGGAPDATAPFQPAWLDERAQAQLEAAIRAHSERYIRRLWTYYKGLVRLSGDPRQRPPVERRSSSRKPRP